MARRRSSVKRLLTATHKGNYKGIPSLPSVPRNAKNAERRHTRILVSSPPAPPDPLAALDRVPWDGGPAYYTVSRTGPQMAKAEAAGWSNPSFFPIAVFLGKPDAGHPASLAAIGINTYMATEYGTDANAATNLANLAAAGIFLLANGPNVNAGNSPTDGWTPARIGTDPNVVGWFLCDEPDMGSGGFIGTNDENGWLSSVQDLQNTYSSLGDGRFTFINFGNGVLGTFWSPNTLDEMVDEIDAFAVDKYPYTSPQVRFEYGRSWYVSDGGTEANSQSSAAYGWNVRRMTTTYQDPDNLKPMWAFVEAKMPFLSDTGRGIITYAQIEGAIWSAIANGARGIAYFQHNGFYGAGAPATDPNTGAAPTTETYALVDGGSALRTAVSTINARVMALAPVINTQSYVWDFGAAGIDTMLKAKDGYAYIFASVGVAATLGAKTFTLPEVISGSTAEKLHGGGTVAVTAGQFSHTFANEYDHEIFKIEI